MTNTQYSTATKSKLKILMTESSPNWGGQEERLFNEAYWLVQHGYKVTVVGVQESRLASKIQHQGRGIVYQSISSWKSLATLSQLLKIYRTEKPDIIHTRSNRDALWGGLLRLGSVRVIRSRHISIPVKFPLVKSAVFRFGANHIIAASQSIADDLMHRGRISPTRIDVIGEGIDLGVYYPNDSGAAIRRELQIPDHAICFAIVAMIRGEKGQRHFVNAAITLSKRYPHAHFLMVGDGSGSYANKIYSLIQKHFPGTHGSFTVAGFRKDIDSIMNAIDVLIVPSTSEAQSLVIPQAFACGKPVIASCVGGIPEVVTNGRNGILFPPRDEECLVAAMEDLINHPDKRSEMGRNALDTARRSLSFNDKMQLLEACYRKILR